MDFGALPPEINSARMYAGPGSSPMLTAAAAWDGLAAELNSAAIGYDSVLSELVGGPWVGPSSMAMAAAAAPYVTWMSATADQAELAGTQARAAAGAFEAAFAMTVPPVLVAENRAQLLMLAATNFFGQNTPAIAANEAEYTEMWAQDAGAMYSYASNAAATAASVTPFTEAPETTSAAGLAAQVAASSQAASTSIGGVQSALSQFIASVPAALQSLTSPAAATSASSVGTVTTSGILGDLTSSSLLTSLAAEYGDLPGFFGMFMGSNALGPLVNPNQWLAFQEFDLQRAAAASALEAQQQAVAAAARGAGGFGGFGGFGGLSGLGQSAAVGGLSVPPGWGWAAEAPTAAMLGGAPMTMPIAAVDPNIGNGMALPMLMGGVPPGAAANAGAKGAGKYGLPLAAVMTRPPAAGYGPGATSPPAAAYPVPAGFPTNGHAPPGYQPAIVYLPANGHASANA